MLCKCSGKYIDIYFNLKITYLQASLPGCPQGLRTDLVVSILVPPSKRKRKLSFAFTTAPSYFESNLRLVLNGGYGYIDKKVCISQKEKKYNNIFIFKYLFSCYVSILT